MKKFSMILLALVFATVIMAESYNKTVLPTVSSGKTVVKVGKYVVVGAYVMSLGTNTDGKTMGLIDSATAVNAPWKVTITSTAGLQYLGLTGISPTGSGTGIYSGVSFTNGVILDGGTGGANGSSVSSTVSVLGY